VSKSSRARLWVSILTCEGLFATLRERLQWAPASAGGAALPQGAVAGPPDLPRYYDYAGALHIHSTYSDGLGTVADVAAAGNRAGLDFVALDDHSNLDAIVNEEDGWYGRTLVLVGTEVTTDQGHLLAMDVPPTLLPLPNEADEVQRRIQDSGGFGFIALPCDLKDHWKDFAARRSGIGLEVFNLSAIARSKISVPGFLLALLRYRGSRPQRAFHWVAARPARELRLWDEMISSADAHGALTPVVGIGSLDAHAVMKVARRKYPFPTYEELFRTLRTHVLTVQPLSGGSSVRRSARASRSDQSAVHAALAAGHCYIAYDNYGDTSGFVFEAVPADGSAPALMGDQVALPPPEPREGDPAGVLLRARAPRTRTLLHLYKDGRRVAVARGGELFFTATEPGAYRVEVYLYRHRLGRLCLGVKPWVFSNPIYVQPAGVSSHRPASEKSPQKTSKR
jgi:hypothetical protein